MTRQNTEVDEGLGGDATRRNVKIIADPPPQLMNNLPRPVIQHRSPRLVSSRGYTADD